MARPKSPTRLCAHCGKEFYSTHKEQKHCNRDCYFAGVHGKRRFVEGRTGYVVVHKGSWRQAEHRYVMEQILGRKLRREESVHHKNGNRADNRPENLELWAKNHLGGQRASDIDIWSGNIAPYHFGAV